MSIRERAPSARSPYALTTTTARNRFNRTISGRAQRQTRATTANATRPAYTHSHRSPKFNPPSSSSRSHRDYSHLSTTRSGVIGTSPTKMRTSMIGLGELKQCPRAASEQHLTQRRA
jgi:hypothetical protein